MMDEELAEAIREAWTSSFPAMSFDPGRSLAAAGLDSLDTLNFVLALEKIVGRRIPLDLIEPDVTPLLLRALLSSTGAQPGSAPILMIPGMLGDDPLLAGFRRACGGEISFELLSPPDLLIPSARLADIGSLACNVADEIELRQCEGPIRLGGYSFGANVAFETASLLIARGREVAFVGLIDPVPPETGTAPPWTLPEKAGSRLMGRISRIASLLSPRGESPLSYTDWLIFLFHVQAGASEAARRRALASRRPLHPHLYSRRHVHLLRHMRARALRDWRPAPLDAFAFLATSDSFAEPGDDSHWAGLLPSCETIRIEARHLEILRPGQMESLAEAFSSAAGRSMNAAKDEKPSDRPGQH